eukprot:scaffold65004_cov85-Phaeocystis_antarctica.AAC.2
MRNGGRGEATRPAAHDQPAACLCQASPCHATSQALSGVFRPSLLLVLTIDISLIGEASSGSTCNPASGTPKSASDAHTVQLMARLRVRSASLCLKDSTPLWRGGDLRTVAKHVPSGGAPALRSALEN